MANALTVFMDALILARNLSRRPAARSWSTLRFLRCANGPSSSPTSLSNLRISLFACSSDAGNA